MKIDNIIDIISPESGDIDKETLHKMIYTYLDKYNKMILAYNNEAGEPVQSLMLYAIDEDFNIHFGTLKRFPKYEALVQNPPLSITVQEEKENGYKVATIKAVITEELSEKEKLQERLNWFRTKNSCEYYLENEEDFVMFKAQILSARLLDGSDGSLVRFDLTL